MTIGYPPPSEMRCVGSTRREHIIDSGMPLTLQGPSWPVCLVDIKSGRFHPLSHQFDNPKPYIPKVVPCSIPSITHLLSPLDYTTIFARQVRKNLSQNVHLHSYFQVSCPVCCRLGSIQSQQQVPCAVAYRGAGCD